MGGPGAPILAFGFNARGRGPYGAGVIRISACLGYLAVRAPSATVSAVL
jgi:hypothetical protein